MKTFTKWITDFQQQQQQQIILTNLLKSWMNIENKK